MFDICILKLEIFHHDAIELINKLVNKIIDNQIQHI